MLFTLPRVIGPVVCLLLEPSENMRLSVSRKYIHSLGDQVTIKYSFIGKHIVPGCWSSDKHQKSLSIQAGTYCMSLSFYVWAFLAQHQQSLVHISK